MTKATWVLIVGAVGLIVSVNVSGVDYRDDWAVVFPSVLWFLLLIPIAAAITSQVTKSSRLLGKMITAASPAEVQAAIDHGARVNAKNRRGQTPLMLAAVFNGPEVIAALIAAGANVHATCKRHRTALMYAAQAGNVETAKVLLHAGADTNVIDDEGASALLFATRFGNNPELITDLLQAGADLNAKTNDGWSALAYAASYCQNPAVVITLFDAGMDIHARIRGISALMFATTNANVDVLKVFIDAGAYVNASGPGGKTPLMWAARFSPNPDAIDILLQAGANGTVRDDAGKTAFDYIRENAHLKASNAYAALRDAALATRS